MQGCCRDFSDKALHAFDDDGAIIGTLEPVLARRAIGRAVIRGLRLVKGGKLEYDYAFDRRSLKHFLAAIKGARRTGRPAKGSPAICE